VPSAKVASNDVRASVPLERRLFALTAAAILPLAAAAGTGLYVLLQQQGAQARGAGLELARSVAGNVALELDATVALLQALATSRAFDSEDDFVSFRERAARVLELKPDWVAISLADAAGQPIEHVVRSTGGAEVAVAERASLERVLRSGSPAIGNLTYGAGGWLFAVRVPVLRQGQLRHVLTALVQPETIRAVITRQHTPGDWLISIVDANGRRVARSRAHEQNLGGRLAEGVAAVVARGGEEGFGIARSLENEEIYVPYSRLQCGWTAVLGIPTVGVQAATRRSLIVYGGGVLLSLVLGLLAAAQVARSITRPIAELRASARALGRREPPRPPGSPIHEIRDVGRALAEAGQDLARSDAQRELLLLKERQAREAAEAADRAKEEFLAVLSHELRTPLNAAYGWARMLQSGQIRDEATAARALDAIVRNADVQVQLIDDLLDVSRITSGKMRLDVRPVDLAEAVHGALDAVRPAAAAKEIRIDTEVEPGAGRISGDPARLQQIVWNLLMNAVKFTPRGGHVALRLARHGSQVELSVADDGQGIAAEMLPHVFERFRQADSSSTRRHGGLGLGLALVKHLVELHGGSVRAESEGEKRGSRFVVTLPVGGAESSGAWPRVPREPKREPLPGLTPLGGVRVLLVDDDPEALTLAESILLRAGAQVRGCSSAADAFRELRRWRPDVLVSDIEMPGEDGYSLIRRVRELTRDDGGGVPAIALTAYGRTQDRVRSLAAGYSMHVPKPVDPSELTAIVASVAPGARAAAAGGSG
jgi:signal transduction histidine kinase/ActR/RegA family two-component response regulator